MAVKIKIPVPPEDVDIDAFFAARGIIIRQRRQQHVPKSEFMEIEIDALPTLAERAAIETDLEQAYRRRIKWQ